MLPEAMLGDKFPSAAALSAPQVLDLNSNLEVTCEDGAACAIVLETM